ncbi:hypothetical protein ACFL6C_05395 [Myxococcota bacterium]
MPRPHSTKTQTKKEPVSEHELNDQITVRISPYILNALNGYVKEVEEQRYERISLAQAARALLVEAIRAREVAGKQGE